MIYPNERKFLNVFPDSKEVKDTYFLISYADSEIKITGVEDKTGKFEIETKKIKNFSEILQYESQRSTPPRPSAGQDILKGLKSAYRIDISTDFDRVRPDFESSRRSIYTFTIKTDNEDFKSTDITLYMSLKHYINTYPDAINIHLDAEMPPEENNQAGQPIVRKLYINSAGNDKFRIKNVHSSLKGLSFKYSTENLFTRHAIEIAIQDPDKLQAQTASIIIELDYEKQAVVEVPVFLIRRKIK